MTEREHTIEWLASFVVSGAPRGAAARGLALALADALDSPQDFAPAVHIVGTAGKGSVAARLTARAVAGGIHVATHQSPHVYDVRERFMIDGELPSWTALERAIDEVSHAVEIVRAGHDARPTFFAITAALSWVLGRSHGVDLFVTEAGIGGRNDATSVLSRPDTLTVVTRVGLDHTETLGSTITAITAEKAAVMSGRRVAVLGPQSEPDAVTVVREIAEVEVVDLIEVSGAFADWRSEADATADAVVAHLAERFHLLMPPVDVVAAPGRLEERSLAGRRVILDGAHNALKLGALAAVLGADVPAVVVAAVGASKDLAACAVALAAFGAPVIAIEFGGPTGPWSRPASDLADAVEEAGGRAEAVASAGEAVRRVVAVTAPDATVLVCGSFLILNDIVESFEKLEPQL